MSLSTCSRPFGRWAAAALTWVVSACGSDGSSAQPSVAKTNQCCDAGICKSSAGPISCSSNTADEASSERACLDAPTSTAPAALDLADSIQAASGRVTSRSFHLVAAYSGPGGCLAGVSINIGNCRLDFGPPRDSAGALTLVPPEAGNYCPSEGLGTGLAGTVSFQGISCPNSTNTFADCYAGTFELRLTSHAADSSEPVLTGTPFHLEGATCPVSGGRAGKCDP